MKTIILFSLILLVSITQAKPQDTTQTKPLLGKNEVYASYGFLSFTGLGIGLSRPSFNKDFPSDYFFNKEKYNVKSVEIPPLIGALNFGYKRYFVKNKIAVSMNLSYGQINTQYSSKINDTLSFKTKDYLLAIMPGFEYHYFNRKIVQLYSGVQFGVLIHNQKYNDYKSEIKHKDADFAFQIDAIGIRVGKQIGGFVELGFGFAGIVKIGISGRF